MVVASPLISGKWSLKKINATVVNDIWPETLFFTLIAAMVASVTERTQHKLGISNSLITVLGTVLGLVISFRTSSAYERYQDGRKLWTNIAIASRNLAQLLWIHVSPDRIKKTEDVDQEHIKRERLKAVIEKRTMINLIQAFAVSVKHFLRGEPGIYYQDLYPLIAFLPRHYVDSADPTHHDTLPMWADHEKLVETARSTPSTLSHHHSHKKSKPRSDYFDPEKALPHVVSEIPLQPARNPPHATIYDHVPLLIVFKPFILIPKWLYKRYLRRNEHIDIEADTGSRTLTGKKKAPSPITSNIPLEITLYLHSYVQFLLSKPGLIQPAIATGLITNLGLLQDTAHLRMSLWLYLAFLPFQVVSTMGWWTIPGTCFASFLLLGFLEIGQEIENPFNYDENDLDLDKFCLAIQRELHEVTAHPTPDPHFYVFSQFNRPFAPSDDRTAEEILSDVNHEYHTHRHSMDPIRRTLLRNWKEVQQVTRKHKH
ncbi:hypothetical protein Clacol_004311 [Clathrus columnatus]|uniref:Uncharacterized protein n=1 Tax=Clathrus columnatus TaxID=1419009 RepID=A0AAV5AAZ0_9AGAM|nr:hypothetical protein Clacol_004311 [Clathrus columnatus]